MSDARLIKTLQRGTPTYVDKARGIIFGNTIVPIYDEDSIYNVNDIVYLMNDGIPLFYSCVNTGATGTFTASQWELLSLINNNDTIVNVNEPVTSRINTWYKPIKYGYADVSNIYPEIPTTHFAYTTPTGSANITIANNDINILTGIYSLPRNIAGHTNITVSSSAFLGADIRMTGLIIPDNVTSIGSYSFGRTAAGSGWMHTLSIGNGITAIPARAFVYQDELDTVDIPATVERIDMYAFGYCTSLTSVTIRNRYTTIDDNAFTGCTSLTTVVGYADSTAHIFAAANSLTFTRLL